MIKLTLRAVKLFLLVVLALSVVACAPNTTTESAGEFIDSSTTTTKVKAQLLDDLGSRGLAIKVKTYKREVQLSGFVDSMMFKQRAGVIAASVADGRSVRNDLIVK